MNDHQGESQVTQRLLQGYPGAAMLVSATGDIAFTNENAAGVVSLLNSGDLPDVQGLITQASDTSTIATGALAVPTEQGEILLEFTVVPGVGTGLFLLLARDLTMERNLRSALVESRQRYKDLVEVSSDFYWETDTEGRFVFVSPRGGLGYLADELINDAGEDYVTDPESYTPLPFVSERPLEDIEMWFRSKEGETVCMLVSCVPLFHEQKGAERLWSGTRGVCRDVTDERSSEAALARARHREQLLSYIVSSVRDELDPQNMLNAAVTATARALGVAGCRIYRQSDPGQFLVAADYGNIEKLEDLDAAVAGLEDLSEVAQLDLEHWSVLAVSTHYRQTVNGVICIWKSNKDGEWSNDQLIMVSDIANQLGIASEQVTNHERIVALSRTDSMTGLLNRRAFFEEELPRRVARLERSRQTAALFYVDMDNFKLVNDVHGHQAGDDAIMYLRDMLMDFTRPGDVIARLGGDEFAMWLDGIRPEVAEMRVGNLIEVSQSMREFSGAEDRPLGISVGVAVFDPDLAEPLDELLARADAAMYSIKKAGKGGFHMAPMPAPKTTESG
ncbi:MAG: diguanylate cyclase [Rhodospirillaceae bacterium]|jgi:diguanylate cyclase (GGDEF)-like protein/PAS domain S-box-containing protein|nr:diguanylate cyclase [Rhodospirillaceae bacterium]